MITPVNSKPAQNLQPKANQPRPAFHTAGFDSLGLIPQILEAVKKEGYEKPTPIQGQAIPRILTGRDLLACAQTGTGKTAAFALPMLQLLNAARPTAQNQPAQSQAQPLPHYQGGIRPLPPGRPVRALILTPTRELASQIGESFTNYGNGLNLTNTVIFGGVGQRSQENAIRKGVDIVIATPGRLLDLLNQRIVNFKSLEIFVLDEADRMLDMGFIHDVKKVIATLPKKRQTLFFSATMPGEISKLASQILTNPDRVEVAPVATTAEKITQAVFHTPMNLKTSLLIHMLADEKAKRVLVFTRTKRDANRVAESVSAARVGGAAAIHGNKSQGARERALSDIKEGKVRVLVATDIAARGIDIDQVTHVFNYDIPNVPESYVHRIGRTARAGHAGIAISFCSPEERGFLKDIERLIRMSPPVLQLPQGLLPEVKKKGRQGGGGGRPRDPRAAGAGNGHSHGGGQRPAGRPGQRSDGRRDPRGSSSQGRPSHAPR